MIVENVRRGEQAGERGERLRKQQCRQSRCLQHALMLSARTGSDKAEENSGARRRPIVFLKLGLFPVSMNADAAAVQR